MPAPRCASARLASDDAGTFLRRSDPSEDEIRELSPGSVSLYRLPEIVEAVKLAAHKMRVKRKRET
jgi:hypothetical protein